MASYIDQHLIKGEHIVHRATPTLWAYGVWICIGCVLQLAIGAGTVIGGAMLLSVWLRYKSTELAFTNMRLIAKTGLISRRTIEMKLSRIESIQVDQSLAGRILNYGTIIVSGAGDPQAPIRHIKNPMAFRKALLEHQNPSEPAATSNSSQNVPDKDNWEGMLYDEPSIRRVNLPVILRYTDGAGQQTQRLVDIKAYSPHPGGMVYGHCHMRNANRTFLFQRIQTATDAETGELLPDLRNTLDVKWAASTEATMDRLTAEHSDVLKTLLFVARADGAMRAAELAVMTRMCKEITGDDRITPAMLKSMLSYIGTPSITSFTRTYNAMRRADAGKAARTADACRAIIATQKTVHPTEQAVLDILNKASTT